MMAALLSATVFAPAGCASFPAAPSAVGEDYPSTGIPTSVAWPSDWLESLAGESDAVGGTVVGLRLENVAERWVWRVRSTDPGRKDLLGESDADSTSAVEALIDATDLALVQKHDVTLTSAEADVTKLSYYDAVQQSGEGYPGPRLVELKRVVEERQAAWRVTTYDTGDGDLSSRTL
ncbi:hypothetical protein [Curtobacterium sp. VKM Ac-1376]|uniref:hypothetical protein n=1 Tax=Curtobacterium sp. VKM Ac-1376 TaxID=123312 RepID=UPI00188CA57E|nr:hypothetical protein [Curtobacterium sp. VKM Ac-1376]MBF4615696.1 hypothetical protein [Curtobacterium sp. VKM Ac-1376]